MTYDTDSADNVSLMNLIPAH